MKKIEVRWELSDYTSRTAKLFPSEIKWYKDKWLESQSAEYSLKYLNYLENNCVDSVRIFTTVDPYAPEGSESLRDGYWFDYVASDFIAHAPKGKIHYRVPDDLIF
jgi:hypothetical protein